MISFEAKPIPVDRPPEMANSQATLIWNTDSEIISQIPQISTWITFLLITSFEAAVVGSLS